MQLTSYKVHGPTRSQLKHVNKRTKHVTKHACTSEITGNSTSKFKTRKRWISEPKRTVWKKVLAVYGKCCSSDSLGEYHGIGTFIFLPSQIFLSRQLGCHNIFTLCKLVGVISWLCMGRYHLLLTLNYQSYVETAIHVHNRQLVAL